MKKILQVLSVTVCMFNTNHMLAQFNYSWTGQIGGTLNDKGTALLTDAGGNVYSVGTFSGTCDFDPSATVFTLTSYGSSDVYISKFSNAGAFVWAKRIGGAGADNVGDIAKDASGNLYICGDFSGSCDFDPSIASFSMTTGGTGSDIYVCKLDQNGNFIWAKQMGGNWWDRAVSITIDGAGDVITTGDFATATGALTSDFDPGPGTYTFTTGSGGGNTDMFISKLTSAGNFVWAKQIGGPSGDFGLALEVDATNNIHIAGYFTGTTDFDPNASVSNLTSGGFEDIFVLKLDALGNYVWAKNMGGNTVDYGKAIALDILGNVYVTGSYRAIADFDPSAASYTLAATGDDIFVCKLDNAGNFLWAKGMGASSADQGNGIWVDAAGNVYSTGVFRLSVDFDPGPGTYSLNTLGLADAYIQKLNANGNFMWAAQLGSATDDFGISVCVDASGNVYSTGYFTATCDFDPNGPVQNLTSFGQNDAYVHKMCQTPIQPGSINGPTSICGSATHTYSIAAITGATSYNWSLPAGWAGSSSTTSISAASGSSGIFTVSASNACGAGQTQTLSVSINALPVVSVNTSSSTICIGQSATLTASGANTYSWLPLGTGSTIVVNPTITTNYTVTGTDGNGCTNSFSITQSVTSCANGIAERSLNALFNVCPNPANKIIELTFSNNDRKTIRIYNSIGELAHFTEVGENSLVNVEHFAAGIYFIEVNTATSCATKKIIKQ